MKQRLLVMNGQKIVQAEQEGAWVNQKVEKAGALKPGFYNLYTAKVADKTLRHEGPIVHADQQGVYQQVGRNMVMHSRGSFDKVPESGTAKSITYDYHGKASVVAQEVTLTRSRSR